MGEARDRARVWAIELTVCLATGAMLGAIGPFGSFLNDSLVVRIAYWVVVFVSCGALLGLALRVLGPRARQARLPVWAWVPALLLAVALPLTGLTRLVAVAFWPGIRDRVNLADWYGQTVLICLVYLALHAAVRRRVQRPVLSPDQPDAGEPTILRYLPPHLGRDLLCMSMEDHYVRLHTIKGSVLVLTSLNQALGALGDLEGLRVHRSWWVARHAVTGVVEEGRNMRLQLTGGLEAPVSRSSVSRLRQAGWLETQ